MYRCFIDLNFIFNVPHTPAGVYHREKEMLRNNGRSMSECSYCKLVWVCCDRELDRKPSKSANGALRNLVQKLHI